VRRSLDGRKSKLDNPTLSKAHPPPGRARAEGEGEVMNFREGWRSFVLYAIFFVLLVTGWHELPGDDSILPWYVRLCST